MTPAQIQTLIDACRTSPADLVTWLELKAVLEGLKNQDIGLVLTTTGTTGAATFDNDTDTLNIPNYTIDTSGFVPYTGATGNVTLGEYGMLSGWYRLDLTPTGTPTDQGTMYWDDNQKTLALIMNGTTQKVGHDQFYYVKNSTGSTIAKGTAVRFAGTDGTSGHLLIAPFLADGSNPSSYFMGVTSEEITNGNFGKVQSFGRLDGIDTSAFADGDILYASTTVAGGFQTTVPIAPNNIVQVAAVVAAANNGKLLIRPTLGSKLTSDESVKLTSVANGNVLQYNSTLAVWENVAPSSLAVNNIYTANGTLTGNRTVTMGGNTLTFLQTQNSTALHTFSNQSTGSSAEAYYNVINSNFDMRIGIRGNGAGNFAALERSSGMISYNGDTSLCINATNVNATIKFTTNSFTERMRIFAGGNIGINTTTDAGFRLDVNGTMRVQNTLRIVGTSGYTADLVQFFMNGGGVTGGKINAFGQWFISNGGTNPTAAFVGSDVLRLGQTSTSAAISFNNSLNIIGQWAGTAGTFSNSSNAETVVIVNNNNTANASGFTFSGDMSTGQTASKNLISLKHWANSGVLTFSNVDGNQTYTLINADITVTPTNTGKALRGFYYNPTISGTSLSSNTAIHTVTGDVLLATTSGNVGIGTTSPTYKLHTVGTGRITGNVELSVDSGAYTIIGATGDTSYRLSVDGDLRVYGNIRTAQPTGGTATGVWRLGSAANGTFILDTGTCVEIEIGGTLYKLATVT